MDLRIIPDEPWSGARDTYRRLASEDRPGDPWAVPFDPRPRRYPIHLIRACLTLAAGSVVLGALWLL